MDEHKTTWGKKLCQDSVGDTPVFLVHRNLYQARPGSPVYVQALFLENCSSCDPMSEHNHLANTVSYLQETLGYIESLGYTEVSLELRVQGNCPSDESAFDAHFLGKRLATQDEIEKGEPT